MKVFIAGDFVPQNRVTTLFKNKQYDDIFSEIKDVILKTDYSVVNLEAPIAVSPQCEKIEKIGPCLSADLNTVEALRYAGIKCVTLANNHIRDYGDWGVSDTIFYCTKNEIDTVGAGLDDIESKSMLVKRLWGGVLTIINCCEHEFSIAGVGTAGANPINPIHQYYAIQKAKSFSDYVIIIVHGGIEQYKYPTTRMVDSYRFFVDAGADAVINHHQHCFSGYEVYNGKPIFYGLGNFLFDNGVNAGISWTTGYSIILNLENNHIGFEIIPYRQCLDKPSISILRKEDEKIFFEELAKINFEIAKGNLEYFHNKFMNEHDKELKAIFSPYSNKYLTSLYVRKLIPGFMRKRNWLSLLGKIECESHRERLIKMITNTLN